MKVPDYGPLDAKIIAVGEAPGAQEEKEGQPFVGPAGEYVRKVMLEVGIDPERDVYWTNICKVRPPNNKLEIFFPNGIPNQLVIDGMGELNRKIREMKPNVVVALGAYAAWALVSQLKWDPKHQRFSGITSTRGFIQESTMVPGQKVVCTFHPSYICRQRMKDSGTFKADLARVAEEAMFPELRRPDPEFFLNPDQSERWRLRDRIMDETADGGLITADIEYVGGKLLCVGMSSSKDWAMTVATRTDSDLQYVRDILLSGRGLNFQNAAFDASILSWHYDMDVFPDIEYDTLLAAHASSPELPKSLEYLASIYTRWHNWKGLDWKQVKAGKYQDMDLWTYNCIDVVVQHEVMEQQWIWDLNDEAVRDVFEFEMELLRTLWKVSERGVRLDHERMQKIIMETNADILMNKLKLRELNGGDLNVKSYPQVGALLERVGITINYSKKGNPITNDKEMANYLTRCTTDLQRDTINLVRDTRRMRDLLSKFLEVELDEDGRTRGMYNPGGTVTGRLASKKFYPTKKGHQQQNIPTDPAVRSLFLPDPGKKYGYFDLERAESFVVAHITNDPLMLQHHMPGRDAHTALASLIFDIPEEEVTSDQRYLGKQTRHAGSYMEGARTMKININKKAHITGVWVTEAECKTFIKKFRSMHQFLRPWWGNVESTLWAKRKLENLLGRPRIFYGHVRSILPEAVAHVPQSTVGDVLNAGLLMLDGVVCDYIRPHMCLPEKEVIELALTLRHDWGFEILQQVHDAVGFQYDPDHEEDVIESVCRLMMVRLRNQKTYEEFIIPVEAAVGPSWGEVKKVLTWRGNGS